ncbi:MAG TPA: hypothetical protein VIT42_02060 [Microlunatus sp.]
MSPFAKGTLIDAALGSILITVLLLPGQALLPQYAPYTPFAIVAILLFFALRLPLAGLVAQFLSFAAGVGWGILFMLVGGPLIAANPASAPVVLGVGITVTIFGILSVHPLLLGRTPFAIVPAVLWGFLNMLIVMLIMPMLPEGAPKLDAVSALAIFAYGCVMTAVMVAVSRGITEKIVGKGWRRVPAAAADAPHPV